MLETLPALAPDPILGLMASFRADPNPRKVDLGVGVYKDEAGSTPVLASVKAAEQRLVDGQASKSYVGPAGLPEFNDLARGLLLGPAGPSLGGRAVTLQMPGGCGALRAGAELIRRARPEAVVWVSDPTWANHIPLLGNAQLQIKPYPYYDYRARGLRFDDMMAALGRADPGDVVLLHGCCHNPCGADLGDEQWAAVAELMRQRGLVPFVDVAYQGFGDGLDADVRGLQRLLAAVPEMLVASSFSKNFGLYRERTGALTVVAGTASQASVAASQVCNVVRGMWSMPPDHGAAIVATVLGDSALRAQWEGELGAMRQRINDLRCQLVGGLAAAGAGDFAYIARERGMFSFLGLTRAQVERLRSEFSIYLVDSSRINVAGLNTANLPYVCEAIAAVAV